MSTGRILAAALVGGLVMFIWGAVVHMATPLGQMGLSMIPNEEGLLSQMKQAVPARGLYFFPGRDMKHDSEAARKDWEERFKRGPKGLLLISPQGGEPMETSQLVIEFVSNVICAFVLALILARWPVSKGTAAILGLGVGLYGWMSIEVSYWNWYGYPAEFTFASAVEQIVGGLLTGLIVALVLGKRKPQPAF
ncbi:MAG TPA: hypothetical protein VMV81_13815 [Phycisphaerae bacterium]|nr:hypothetical protein [Phycisphaerae bacterium]